MKRNVSFLLCFFILMSLSFISLVHGEEVTFPDPNLEAVIREALNKQEGAITEEDLAGLTELGASWREISDLTGIEHCINLEWLGLRGNQIIDISPLSSLTNLQALWLGYNQISDIGPLSGLTNLQTLDLLDNHQISVIGPLSGLTNLQSLDLGGNQISDISPLSGLTNLQSLGLAHNLQISNISPLSGLTKLQWLNLWGNQIIDISPLSGLINLQSLGLFSNNISNINPLASLTDLRVLYLDDNQIQDISPLAGLTKIGEGKKGWEKDGVEVHLSLANNQISDISPLVNNPGIGEGDGIDLRGNPLDIPTLQEREVAILLDTPEFWRELHQPLAEQGYITEGLILDPLNPELLDIGNEVGDEAPDFSLPDELENIVTLSDYRGKNNIVLIFHTGST